jgi:hypothetical protein
MQIEKTDVTHIIKTHLEGKQYKTHKTTLELSKDGTKWFIVSRVGHLQEDFNKDWEGEN